MTLSSPGGPSPGAILTARDVVHAYGQRQVLRGVDLEVHAGEIYALLGPNGAGKTTLIRAVCGRFAPSGGEIRIDGADPFKTPATRAVLGLAPQPLALYGHLTVRENLSVFGSLAGLGGSALAAAVAHAMDVTHTTDRAHVPVKHLSGGYQRRANIAAAILHGPRLLILDEPTVGVDMAAREQVDSVIRALRDGGVAILVVTHDLEQAEGLADRVGFLSEGRKVLEGAPGALITEAFGAQSEVLVHLIGEQREADAALLAAGLARDPVTGSWSRLAVNGYAAAAELDQTLKAAGLSVREIRVRRPSLASLYAHVDQGRVAA